MSFVVPGITHCEKHMNPIGLGQVCEDCEKEMENMPPKEREYAKELEKKKMTNREWLLNQMQNMSDEEFIKKVSIYEYVCNKKYVCREINCGSTKCIKKQIGWLKSEHKEPITLSEAERIILENIDKKFVSIGKSARGEIFYKEKNGDKYWANVFNPEVFEFIKGDYEPYNIEELLKGE